jgi:hypothetical protein
MPPELLSLGIALWVHSKDIKPDLTPVGGKIVFQR